MGVYGCLWVLIGVYGFRGAYEYSRMYMGVYYIFHFLIQEPQKI